MNNSKSAREAYRNGEFTKSGACYTQAAYSALAQDSITNAIDGQIAGGLYYLLHASYGYRRAQRIDRAGNRCEQGILIASDIIEHQIEDTVREGLLLEYIGDFKVLGDIDGQNSVYDKAAMKYTAAGVDSSFSWPSNPLVDKNVTFLTWLHRERNTPVPEDDLECGFNRRIEYKKSQMRAVVNGACKR